MTFEYLTSFVSQDLSKLLTNKKSIMFDLIKLVQQVTDVGHSFYLHFNKFSRKAKNCNIVDHKFACLHIICEKDNQTDEVSFLC